MHRIKDIADLVDDTSDSENSDDDIHIGHSTKMGRVSANIESGRSDANEENGTSYNWSGWMGSSLCHRQALAILSLVALIFASSLAIGYAIVNSDQSKTHNNINNAPQLSTGNDGASSAQQRLEMAERVVTACSEHSLDADISECQHLCRASTCCFESGKYSCEDDEKMDCAVYAGCEALLEGIPLDAAEEDEE